MSKKISLSQVRDIKEQVIVLCLDFIDCKDLEAKSKAIEMLITFAKFYKLTPTKQPKTRNIKLHLREFILNKKGYMTTIDNLYNSLINS